MFKFEDLFKSREQFLVERRDRLPAQYLRCVVGEDLLVGDLCKLDVGNGRITKLSLEDEKNDKIKIC